MDRIPIRNEEFFAHHGVFPEEKIDFAPQMEIARQMLKAALDALVAMGTAVNGMINSVSTLVLFAVVPFNLLKGAVVSVLTTLLYKRIERLLRMR